MARLHLSGTELIRQIDQTVVDPGGLAFWWLGQSGFVFKGGSTVLYLDPFLSPNQRRQTPPPLTPAEVTNASVVLCTHDHRDHIDPGAIPGIAQASAHALFTVPQTAVEKMLSLSVPSNRLQPIHAGETIELAGAHITAIKSKHEFFCEDPQLGFPFLGYLVELNGVGFYHAGDTIPYDGLISTLKSFNPHILMLPINGRDAVRYRANYQGNCTFQEAVDIAGEVQPRLAIPMHHDMYAHNGEDPQKFTDYLSAKYPGINTWVGAVGEKVEFRL